MNGRTRTDECFESVIVDEPKTPKAFVTELTTNVSAMSGRMPVAAPVDLAN